MKTTKGIPLWRNVGLPLAAASVLIFGAPTVSEASELGNQLLFEGTEGEQVQELQELLQNKGFLDDEKVNGVFKQSTLEALQSFQSDYQLTVDGIAGPQTLGALTVLSKGDEGSLVTKLQEVLAEFGHYDGGIDGLFGSKTEKAVTAYQQAEDLLADGIAGPETFSALYQAFYDKAEASKEQKPVQKEESEEEDQAVIETSGDKAADKETKSQEAATFEMEATAYTADCKGCSGITATGIDLRDQPDKKVVAVDPTVIPLGSRVHVEGYGEAIAGDTGGAIKGHKIDLHMGTTEEALEFGRRTVKVTLLQ